MHIVNEGVVSKTLDLNCDFVKPFFGGYHFFRTQINA